MDHVIRTTARKRFFVKPLNVETAIYGYDQQLELNEPDPKNAVTCVSAIL